MVADFWKGWVALPAEVQGAVIGASATVIVGLIGFLAVIVQIGRQARHAIKQNNANEAAKLKLEIYRDILKTCDAAADAEIELSNYISKALLDASTATSHQALGVQWQMPQARFLTLVDLRQKATFAAIGVITVVERWHVIDPRMSVFQDAINAGNYDVAEAMTKFDELALRLFPMAKPGTDQTLPWSPPSPSQLQDLKSRAEPVLSALSTVSCYVSDFRTEMQGILVGGLFDGKTSIRKPLDPAMKVVRLDDHESLRNHFRTQTPWGKFTKQLHVDVAARYDIPNGMTPFGVKLINEAAERAAAILRRAGRHFR